MKKIILSLVGIVVLAILLVGVGYHDWVAILGTILWLPVIVFCDIPVYVLPVTVLLTVVLLIVGIIIKE